MNRIIDTSEVLGVVETPDGSLGAVQQRDSPKEERAFSFLRRNERDAKPNLFDAVIYLVTAPLIVTTAAKSSQKRGLR